MKLSFVERSAATKATVVVFFISDIKRLPGDLQSLDKTSGGVISAAIGTSKFSAKKGKTLSVALPAKSAYKRVIIIGTGTEFTALTVTELGGAVVPAANNLGVKEAVVFVDVLGKLKAGDVAAHMAYGASLRDYEFSKYWTKRKDEDKPTLTALTFAVSGAKAAQATFGPLSKIVDGVILTRNVVSEPANIIYPETLAAECKKLTALGVTVKVLGVAEMKKLGMGALLGVGQGSAKESKLVVMQWNGKKNKDAPVAFVGKGVTFDTGGISIKPAGGMEEMKWDMGGAGAVLGAMKALAGRNAKANVVGVVGLVENMPDGNAQRPGDVVTSMSGQTIEVLNTDAEGRLVLADALWYTQVNYKPKAIVDLATLTGAIIVALGSSRAGLFSNDDKLANALSAAGKEVGEPLWRLPVGDEYDEQINSDIADMQNIGREREAGSITAAQFLLRFIKDKTPWAHLDIAGTAWSKKANNLCPKGATAFGVRLLNELIAKNYEA